MSRAAPWLFLLLCLGACSRGGAREGSLVTLHFTLYADGAVYDRTPDGEPVTLKLGQGVLPAAAERALYGLKAGEQVFVTLAPEQAYGPRDESAAAVVPAARFEGLGPLEAGQRVLGSRGGKPAEATIKKIERGQVSLDFNHRLAGKTVQFRLTLLSVR